VLYSPKSSFLFLPWLNGGQSVIPHPTDFGFSMWLELSNRRLKDVIEQKFMIWLDCLCLHHLWFLTRVPCWVSILQKYTDTQLSFAKYSHCRIECKRQKFRKNIIERMNKLWHILPMEFYNISLYGMIWMICKVGKANCRMGLYGVPFL
jgi:hypothetical protein